MDSTNSRHQINDDDARFPTLRRLRLDAGDLDLLRRNGFVASERCGRGTRFKLRFRRGGRQVVRVLGDADQVAAVKRELAVLQTERRLIRRIAELNRDAIRWRRESKECLRPVLEAHGLKFHGRSVVRPQRSIVDSRP